MAPSAPGRKGTRGRSLHPTGAVGPPARRTQGRLVLIWAVNQKSLYAIPKPLLPTRGVTDSHGKTGGAKETSHDSGDMGLLLGVQRL